MTEGIRPDVARLLQKPWELADEKIRKWIFDTYGGMQIKRDMCYSCGPFLFFRYQVWGMTCENCEYLFFTFSTQDFSLRVFTMIDLIT